MSRWWRAYDEAVDDPKLCLLTDRLHRAWFNICCITSQNGGKLPPIAAVAFKLRTTVDKAKSIIAELVERELVDIDKDGGTAPHNWDARQYKSDTSKERVAAFRKRQRNGECNGGCNVTETASVTPPETETETEQSRNIEKKEIVGSSEPTSKPKYPPAFEDWWRAYPKTPVMSKKEAGASWQRLSEEDRASSVAALPKYRAFLKSKHDHPVVHACRFLSQRRFDGFGSETAEAKPAQPAGFYAADGSPELEAWDRHWKEIKGVSAPRDNKFGWWFETRWPPGDARLLGGAM